MVETAALSLTCGAEDAIAYALQHYFTVEERAEAQRMMATGHSYEDAVAYLADLGNKTLRASGIRPPYLFMTIPGGKVFVYHPQRLFPHHPVLTCSVGHLASRVLQPPSADVLPASSEVQTHRNESGKRYQLFSLFDDVVDLEPTRAAPVQATRRTPRPKKRNYIEQPLRLGTKKRYWERPGWVLQDGYLGYVIEAHRQGFCEVRLVHLTSYHVLASVYLSSLDETTHSRIQAWIDDALLLTDWSRGIAAILKEQAGDRKEWAWSKQLEALWEKHRVRHVQSSLFDTMPD